MDSKIFLSRLGWRYNRSMGMFRGNKVGWELGREGGGEIGLGKIPFVLRVFLHVLLDLADDVVFSFP